MSSPASSALVSVLMITLCGISGLAQTPTCRVPPNLPGVRWSDPATWPGGVIPGIPTNPNVAAVIPAGRTIYFDVPDVALTTPDIHGQLFFLCQDATMRVNQVTVHPPAPGTSPGFSPWAPRAIRSTTT